MSRVLSGLSVLVVIAVCAAITTDAGMQAGRSWAYGCPGVWFWGALAAAAGIVTMALCRKLWVLWATK